MTDIQPPSQEEQRRQREAVARLQQTRMNIMGVLAIVGAIFVGIHILFWSAYLFHVAIKAW